MHVTDANKVVPFAKLPFDGTVFFPESEEEQDEEEQDEEEKDEEEEDEEDQEKVQGDIGRDDASVDYMHDTRGMKKLLEVSASPNKQAHN